MKLARDARTSTLHVMRDLEEDISATTLRKALFAGDAGTFNTMLSPGVAGYIREHGLYGGE